MVQGSSSFHVPDVHIGPVLQQEFTSNQRPLQNQSKKPIQHQISRIRAKPLLPSQHQVMWERKQKGFASIPNWNTTRSCNSQALTGKRKLHIVKTTSASHDHSLAKQAVQKEQWHRNIPIIPLPLLPHHVCVSHTPRTAWMRGVALFSSTLTQFTSAPWANASAISGRFFSKAARYSCHPGLGCLESQNTEDSCFSPSEKKKMLI